MHDDAPTVAARPRRRAVRVGVRVVVFALIGAVLTVAVAWCPLRQYEATRSELPARDALQVWSEYAPSDWPTLARQMAHRDRSWVLTSDMVIYVDISIPGVHYVGRFRQGWPFRAFEGGRYDRVGSGAVSSGTKALEQVDATLGRIDLSSTIARTPLWPGLLTNTVFYAALTWLLWISPGATRRAIRRRRNRCPACNYPVGTTDRCSECGGAVRPASTVVVNAANRYVKPRRRNVAVTRPLVTALVFLLIGLVVTVAVAWGCYGSGTRFIPPTFHSAPTPSELASWGRHLGGHAIASHTLRHSGFGLDRFAIRQRHGQQNTLTIFAAGWPYRAVRIFEARQVQELRRRDGGVKTRVTGRVRYELAWIGLVLDTLLYATLAWLAWGSSGVIRRAHRRRHGRCPACNYPVGSADRCTECGGAVRPASPA